MKKEFEIVRTYHRDSRNPYPGRLESEKLVEISKERRAWHEFGRCLEPSDRGKSAALIFDAAEVTPLWLRLWRIQYAKLPRKAKRILDAMLVDERSRPAARIAGVDHKTVDAWKIKFKVHFDQCLSAYYAFLRG